MKTLLTTSLCFIVICAFSQPRKTPTSGEIEKYLKEHQAQNEGSIPKIGPEDAAKHVGDSVSVCGKVFGGVYLEKSNGQPTILNFGAAFPNSAFTAVMFGKTRGMFPNEPEVYFNDKNVCVLGKIVEYKGKPQIVVTKAEQLVLEK